MLGQEVGGGIDGLGHRGDRAEGNSTPLDRTREAEGGGCGGWSGKDPEKDLVKWRRQGTILLKFRVCQNGLGMEEYIHHGLG